MIGLDLIQNLSLQLIHLKMSIFLIINIITMIQLKVRVLF